METTVDRREVREREKAVCAVPFKVIRISEFGNFETRGIFLWNTESWAPALGIQNPTNA